MTVSTNGARGRAWLEVDLEALVANARVAAVAAGVPLLPLVKANGYGLGMVPVARALEALEPWGFGVATPDEGAELRAAGTERPIVVFTPALPDWLLRCRPAGLQPVLGDPGVLDAWQRLGGGPFHLEIDTGMGRSGIPWSRVGELVTIGGMRDCVGVFTHFACADDDAEATAEQRRRFERALGALPHRPELVHAANSSAIFRGREYAYDLVRPGIFLYGGAAGPHAPQPRPVATFRARVVHVTHAEPGTPASYGWRWSAPRRTRVATVAAGYADGVPRAVAGRGAVVLMGERRPLAGSVNMDMTLLDAGDVPVAPGDIATFFGAEIALDEFAGWAGTNAYEILTGIGGRVERVYGGKGEEGRGKSAECRMQSAE